MKYSKYFGAKRRGFIKSESNLVPRGASHFKSENIMCDINTLFKVISSFFVKRVTLMMTSSGVRSLPIFKLRHFILF